MARYLKFIFSVRNLEVFNVLLYKNSSKTFNKQNISKRKSFLRFHFRLILMTIQLLVTFAADRFVTWTRRVFKAVASFVLPVLKYVTKCLTKFTITRLITSYAFRDQELAFQQYRYTNSH